MNIKHIERSEIKNVLPNLVKEESHFHWHNEIDSCEFVFSCRAIYSRSQIDVLNDRKWWSKYSNPNGDKAVVMYERLEEYCKTHYVPNDSDDYIIIQLEDTILLASCNGSCGYIYISIWEDK